MDDESDVVGEPLTVTHRDVTAGPIVAAMGAVAAIRSPGHRRH
jgi:hypothetical protein